MINFEDIKLLKKTITNFSNQDLKGKTFLIFGGAGSIGKEICKQLLSNEAKVIVADASEYNLYTLEEQYNEQLQQGHLETHLFDISRDSEFSKFRDYQLHATINAAAYKHVPIAEKNLKKVFNNNVLGCLNVLEFTKQKNIENHIFVSSDKAVNPTNFMGSTKTLGEKLVKRFAKDNSSLNFSSVRFGNVFASSGSVIPKFVDYAINGKAYPITDREMKRYFMSIPEAAFLILKALTSFDHSGIYLLDMKQLIKIVDIAEEIHKLVNKKLGHNNKFQVIITGMRDGEKLIEELSKDSEKIKNSCIEGILEVESQLDEECIYKTIDEISSSLDHPKFSKAIFEEILLKSVGYIKPNVFNSKLL